MAWANAVNTNPIKYTCGFCKSLVSSISGYTTGLSNKFIRICPHCDEPTYFRHDRQVPGLIPGNEVLSCPQDIERLYREARESISIGGHTASVLLARKLLMNVAVSLGDKPGKPFIAYVEYLANAGYVPPNGRAWIDHIRKKGNEATHEIVFMDHADAEELIQFSEMLLKFVYEFPSKIPSSTS